MVDPRRVAVFIAARDTGRFVDRTHEVRDYRVHGTTATIDIRYHGKDTFYSYATRRARIVPVLPIPVPPDAQVGVDGEVWLNATELHAVDGPTGPMCRVFYRKDGSDAWTMRPRSAVEVLRSAEADPRGGDVLRYWRAIAEARPEGDPSRRGYDALGFVHPDSALGRYLVGAPVTERPVPESVIFPFRCNHSQRQAVANALSRSVSVIEGPPGTGKTETILNLVANIVAAGDRTVGVVSLSNSAVDNVGEKLAAHGFGYVAAGLGHREKRQSFLSTQETRKAAVERLLESRPPMPPAGRLAEVDAMLAAAQQDELLLAELRSELEAHATERRHFDHHLSRWEVPELEHLPLLRRSSDRILDFLVEAQLDAGVRPGLLGRLRRYFRYGSLRGLDPDDTDTVLRIQQAYYDRRLSELREHAARVEDRLGRQDFDRLVEEHQELSRSTLRAALDSRYRGSGRTTYGEDTYRRGQVFRKFSHDYPVLLSTCHSLRSSIAPGALLDYLVIDEASQVDLLSAGLAMSCSRNLVVVGDRRQLPHIPQMVDGAPTAPATAYDHRRHSILTSLSEQYADQLPVTLLREHYRCDPTIIGYCNKAFYGGQLIPYTRPGPGRPMVVVRTVAGNHMRSHRGGGRSNQREVDVIVREVIPEHCPDVPPQDIGVATPYNRQRDKAAAVLIDEIEASTVHKFQGRQKSVVILTTVLDETWRGRLGHSFVDDPHMINVAVSRAVDKFVLVTNNDLMPTSRWLRDLIGYIRYHNPGQEVVDSSVVSVFDLLYRRYDDRLRRLAARRTGELRYPSEDIVRTVLRDLLAEEQFAHLTVAHEVLLGHLVGDPHRLTPEEARYVRRRASVDFVVYNKVTNEPRLAIEVDGFAYHENDPRQLARDALKDQILDGLGITALRLPTTGSGEEQRIREALARAEPGTAGSSRPGRDVDAGG
jgi:hypothetical protein